MSPQVQEPEGSHDHHQLHANRRASGLLALSAEDKARIGNLIKVLAKERRDKEDLREKLGQQASRLQDLEREREVSQQKEAELVARVSRSVDLLRTYQLEASCRKQGVDGTRDEADMVRPSPELPPLPQLRSLHPHDEENKAERNSTPIVPGCQLRNGFPEAEEGEVGLPRNALQAADPFPSDAVESARQPAELEKQIFALKPPQLSVLQRYLSIQDSIQDNDRQLKSEERPSQYLRQNMLEKTSRSERGASSPHMSPNTLTRTNSFASPGIRPKAKYQEEGYQRLRLGRRHTRWTQKHRATPPAKASVQLERSHSPAASRASSAKLKAGNASTDSRFDSRLTRTLDVPSEPLLGSPLAAGSRQSVKNPGMSLESFSHWPAPLRLESCYAPNMFDLIDSLESGSCVASTREKASEPSSISEELRRLQRELVSIQHKISQGPLWGSPAHERVQTQALGEESPSCYREIFPSFSLGQWKPVETEESQELSQEIDEVLNLLQSVKSKNETERSSQFM